MLQSYLPGGCDARNELGTSYVSLQECAALCTNNPSCISFEHRKIPGDNKCQLSSSCTYPLTVQYSASVAQFDFYEKDSNESGLGCAWFLTGHDDYWVDVLPSGESYHLPNGDPTGANEQSFAYRVCKAADSSSDCKTWGDVGKY